jgi:serine/threonine protein kinase
VLRGDSDPRLGDRLRREAQAMAQLAHPNVVAVYDVGSFDGRMFIAMEYVAGETLARWLETPRSRREILEAYGAAGRGLAAAHAAGIVHRDFKPENVLIGHDGRARVGDFGLARAFGAAELLHSAETAPGSRGLASSHACMVPFDATASGTLLGTPFYMAPELYGGSAADTRSDQFSFSVALFTALGGERRARARPAAGARGTAAGTRP